MLPESGTNVVVIVLPLIMPLMKPSTGVDGVVTGADGAGSLHAAASRTRAAAGIRLVYEVIRKYRCGNVNVLFVNL